MKVAAYEAMNWPDVEELLRKSTLNRLLTHKQFVASQVRELVVARAAGTFANDRTLAWVALRDQHVAGAITATDLPWDSTQLGMPAARLDYLVAENIDGTALGIKSHLIREALSDARLSRMQHITARVDAHDISSIHALEQNGFITVDGILTLARTVPPDPMQHAASDIEVRLAGPQDADAAAALARVAFKYDRFHSDPAIPAATADNLHAEWLRNSCSGNAADAVLLAFSRGKLAGFITCKIQSDTRTYLGKTIGTIVLVATAADYRGRGVAMETTMASLEWFRKHGVDWVEVGTQFRNIPAARLYQRCGFEIVAASFSLRRLGER